MPLEGITLYFNIRNRLSLAYTVYAS
jgi:hypothetical protein